MASTPRPYLGSGLASPLALTPDGKGALLRAQDEALVKQSIWIILGTSKGERVMRPDFGSGLSELVFDLNNATTRGRVARAVREALARFEPRIDVDDVEVSSEGDGSRLAISIDYRIRATNVRQNLVYPFYLDAGADS